MSITLRTNVDADELIEFLLGQHVLDTGIPVHPFSVVNAELQSCNGTFGITDGTGTLFVDNHWLGAYGDDNRFGAMLHALHSCGVKTKSLIWEPS